MDAQFGVFLQLHEGLPRQAPGSDVTTHRLIELAGALPTSLEVLDVGCGPGRATLVIADALPGARVTAVDLHQPYLDELVAAAARVGFGERITTVRASMTELPFDDGSFDLVWSEGAIYIMGFDTGLRTWRRLLRPRGTVVVTEATWFTATPSERARTYWNDEYPSMVDVAANRRLAEAAGYEVVATHRLPNSDWWDEYYRPLSLRLDAFAAGDEGAAAVVSAERREIDLHREHGDEYGYTGFVLRRTD